MTIKEQLNQKIEKAKNFPNSIIEYNFDLKKEGITESDFADVKHYVNDSMKKGSVNLIYKY